MRWPDERFIKLYTRDTIDWLTMSFEAQGLLALLLRKVDRAGILHLGRQGARGVATAVGHPSRWEAIEPALKELLEDTCVVIQDGNLVVRNFVEAQEAVATPVRRKQDQRERDRDTAMAEGFLGSSNGADKLAEVTRRHAKSPNVTPEVTSGHAMSRTVTPSHERSLLDETRRDEPDETKKQAAAVAPLVLEESPPLVERRAPDSPLRQKPDKPPDPRLRPLAERLCAVFLEERHDRYAFQRAKDAEALKRMLASAGDGGEDEIERRWRRALTEPEGKWLRCSTLAQLASKWNDLSGGGLEPPERAGRACVACGRETADGWGGADGWFCYAPACQPRDEQAVGA